MGDFTMEKVEQDPQAPIRTTSWEGIQSQFKTKEIP